MSDPRDTFADLPILEEVGDDLEQAFRAQEHPARRPWWRRRALVVAIATGVAVLLVPTAIATKSLWTSAADDSDPDHPARPTRPIELDAPKAPTDRFRLSVSETNVGMCLHVFITGGGLGESCSSHISVKTLRSMLAGGGAHDAFVVGATAKSVSAVRVTASGQTQIVKTFTPDSERLAKAQVPADFKLYVAFFPRSTFDSGRVTLEALDASGNPIGREPNR